MSADFQSFNLNMKFFILIIMVWLTPLFGQKKIAHFNQETILLNLKKLQTPFQNLENTFRKQSDSIQKIRTEYLQKIEHSGCFGEKQPDIKQVKLAHEQKSNLAKELNLQEYKLQQKYLEDLDSLTERSLKFIRDQAEEFKHKKNLTLFVPYNYVVYCNPCLDLTKEFIRFLNKN